MENWLEQSSYHTELAPSNPWFATIAGHLLLPASLLVLYATCHLDTSHPLFTLRRFASRTRLFSREPSVATNEEVSEHGSTRSKAPPLVTQHSCSSSPLPSTVAAAIGQDSGLHTAELLFPRCPVALSRFFSLHYHTTILCFTVE